MSNGPPGKKLLITAGLLVLALRMLAWSPSAAGGEPRLFINQTIPTRTPTPAVQPSPSVLPTRADEPSATPRGRTPRPTEPAQTPPAAQTSLDTRTPPAPGAGATAAPPGPDSGASPVPGATMAPGATVPPAESTSMPPGATEPAALPASTLQPAARVAASPTLPPWTPMAHGLGAGAGPTASCLWPLAGLLLVVLGVALFVWQGRRAGKAR